MLPIPFYSQFTEPDRVSERVARLVHRLYTFFLFYFILKDVSNADGAERAEAEKQGHCIGSNGLLMKRNHSLTFLFHL